MNKREYESKVEIFLYRFVFMKFNNLMYLLRYFVACTVFTFLILVTFHVQAASFDCAQAKQTAEKRICADLNLNDADVKLTTTYHIVQSLVPMGTRGAIHDDQVRWLRERNTCKSRLQCLVKSYQKRQHALDLHLQRIRAQGPY